MALKRPNNTLPSVTPFNVPANRGKLEEVSRKELGETEDLKVRCLTQLRELINDNQVACITRNDFLLRFLRTRKFDVQRSFQAVQNYSKQRVALHNRFLKLQPDRVKAFLNQNVFGYLPYRDTEGRLIAFAVTGAWDRDNISDEEFLLVTLLMLHYAAEKESSQICGLVFIMDCTSYPVTYIPALLKHLKTFTSVLFNGLPVRYAKFHVLNESSVIRFVLRLFMPLVPQKLMERILFHGKTREILFEYFVPEILPSEGGGSLGPFNCDHLIADILDYLKKFKDEQRHFLAQNA